jgi:hypothetical protein
MADENPTNPELADEVQTGPLVGETVDDSGPVISAFNKGDDELLAELLGGNEDDEAAAPVVEKPEAEAKATEAAPGSEHTDADARGIEILIAERGFTAAQAARMAEKDPDMVRELGAAAIEAEGKAVSDPKDETEDTGTTTDEAKPAADDEADAGEVKDKVLEVLGRTFDKAEAQAVADAIALVAGKGGKAGPLPDVAALVEKQVAGKLESITKTLTAYDAALSNLMAKAEAVRLAEVHPEIKTPDGYAKVYAKAQTLAKAGRFNSIGDLMDAAATIVYGPKRQAEIAGYKDRVNKHRADGVAENPGVRAPAGVTMDRDDLILDMALGGKTETEIKEELARASRR